MKKHFTPMMIIAAIFFCTLSGYAFYRLETTIGISLILAAAIVCYSLGDIERLRVLGESARNDATRYRSLWELECAKNALTSNEKRSSPDYPFN